MANTSLEDKVVAKGKGEMQTYWVEVGTLNKANSESDTTSGGDDGVGAVLDQEGSATFNPLTCAKTARLVKWNVDLLANLLKQIDARRDATNVAPLEPESDVTVLSH
jgi:hypothetical protein